MIPSFRPRRSQIDGLIVDFNDFGRFPAECELRDLRNADDEAVGLAMDESDILSGAHAM